MKKRLFSILATLTFTALTVIPANITAQKEVSNSSLIL